MVPWDKARQVAEGMLLPWENRISRERALGLLADMWAAGYATRCSEEQTVVTTEMTATPPVKAQEAM